MDYVQVLKDLIAIDTSVSPDLDPGAGYARTVDYLEPLFRRAGFQTERVLIPPQHAEGQKGRLNLLAHRRDRSRPRLILYTHMDVVPAQGWEAFSPKVEDGRIYGRGAADMKGAIAALLLALEMARDSTWRFDTSVMVTTDEEMTQASQIRYLRPWLEPVAGAGFFSLDTSFGYVQVAALGCIHMEIRVKGRSVHSGMSHLGENAVEKAALVLDALLDLKKRVTARRSRVPVHPATGLTVMEPRLNINMVHGGIKANIVPDECVITVDRRLIPEEDVAAAEQELLDALWAVPGVEWDIPAITRNPTVPPLHDPVAGELAEILRQVTGRSGQYGEMGSGDFGPIVVLEWGARLFGLGTIRADCGIHGRNEFVYQRDIEDLALVITRFVSE